MLTAMRIFSVVILLIFCTISAVYGDPAIVYDNSTTHTLSVDPGWIPHGFWAFNRYDPYEQLGDEITLAGTEREVVRFDMILSSTEPTTLGSLTLTFREMGYDPSGRVPQIGEEIWSCTQNNIAVNGLTTITFTVPNILVPDNFAWLASSSSETSGLASFDPPTVGSSLNWFWDYSVPLDSWYTLDLGDDPIANFGATVWAVPEPASLGLFLLGGCFLAGRIRRNP